MDWLCRDCFKLDGDALELHIQAHARSVPWSYDEVKQAIQELRATAAHCEDCRAQIDRDLKPMTVTTAVSQFGLAWGRLVAEVGKAVEPLFEKALGAPDDIKERALYERQNRNTGPARPSGPKARRPRRHQ